MRRLVAALGVTLVVSGCGWFGGDDIAVGTCLQRGDVDDEGLAEVSPIDCDRPHDLEVVGLLDIEGFGGDYPGDTELSRWAFERCAEAFEEHVGTSYGRSTLDLEIAAPDEARWEDGDRQVRCAAASLDGRQREGSARS